MKLSAEIIYSRLKDKYPLNIYGKGEHAMDLLPPEFYMESSSRLYSHHLYVATVEHLPQRPVIEKNVAIVCIGDNARLSYYIEHACVILISGKADFFDVFQSVQDIYNLFFNWESQLLRLFSRSATIQDILDCSYPVFRRPMSVLDENWQYVATVSNTGRSSAERSWNSSREPLDLSYFLQYLKEKELYLDKKGAFILDMEPCRLLCVNLFNSSKFYIGCLFIELGDRECAPGETALAEYLAHIVERITETSPALMESEAYSLTECLKCILNELPLSHNQRQMLKKRSRSASYICISMHFTVHFSALPVSYLCTSMSGLLSDSIFIEQNNTILGLIPITSLSGASPAEGLDVTLGDLISQMHLCIGISNTFSDLFLLRSYYFQAEAAIENGQIYRPGQNIYSFTEIALEEMITNSLGNFPVESYFPDGFQKLLEHDENGGVSYLDTLTIFLEENMSYARASRRLYIHRSTLIERIDRIQRELSVDLEDPDQRLQIQLLLKAMQMEKFIRSR